jgi:diaminopimelate decarboxylase
MTDKTMLSSRALLNKYGSPLFVLDVLKLLMQFTKLNNAFKAVYRNTVVAYSFKTNYLPYICKTLYKSGSKAEVIAGFEFELAKKLGIPGKDIIVNGPYKPEDELFEMISYGCKINVDNLDELKLINKIAKKIGKIVEIGIRINFNLTTIPWKKFGFDADNNDAYDAIKFVHTKLKNLKIIGLHIHLGTNIIDPDVYKQASLKTLSFINSLEKKLSVKIKYIDFGGGFPSTGTIPINVNEKEWHVPSIEEYAKAICIPLNRYYKNRRKKPLLILEPGRYLVDESMYLLATVVAAKRINGIKSVFIDAGVNILPSSYYRKHNIQTNKKGRKFLTDVYGPLCMQVDIIESGLLLPDLKKGDIIKIPVVGAYELSQSMQFTRTRPAVISINNKKVILIHRKETLADIIACDNWDVINEEK